MTFEDKAKKFITELPYKQNEYAGKNWGHSWHSLCSYQGKLKPAIAYHLINSFTSIGETVLDPLCGVGTIPFEACLNGRIGIGNDLSQQAYSVTTSKINKPNKVDVLDELQLLNNYIESHKNDFKTDSLPYSDWGFNGKVPEYYELNTYKEILAARNYYKETFNSKKNYSSYCFVLSIMMHILHGNRPYALSRNSHPLTPYKPTGDFIYKNVIEHIKDKIEKSYKEQNFNYYLKGQSFNFDFYLLKNELVNIDWIITSPPFSDSIKFYINNWLRLWFIGWEPEDFKKADSLFLDGRQKNNFDEYISFFEMCKSVLKPNGKVILHLGKTKKVDMAKELALRAEPYFNVVFIGEENVDDVQHHGIKDKGGTFVHQYLFLEKKASC